MVSQPIHKTALVTGGNKGIGYAICQGLLNAGFDVFLAARDAEQGRLAVESLSAEGKSARLIVLDVADDDSIEAAASSIAQITGSLDVLVNNAGIYPDEGVDILTVSRTVLAQAMNTNAFSSLEMTQAFLPFLEKADSPKVINISSGNGQLEGISENVPSYSLSKLALNGATILLANSLRPKGIAVYAMCPGWVKTDMGGPSAPRSPEEGADTAVWLATAAGMAESGNFFRDRTQQPY
ncbi:SDR family oxidoreductase [Leptolyngbya sp. BC1307]|uniref:SDR family oxidoreductase n=1 Tax=Leptolyngbya sp. BC1307 TaxID=2029589 RepID=UPI000EFAF615|nr:SDR family oxidoreductase [Leptolyngbya sp. BC1307]